MSNHIKIKNDLVSLKQFAEDAIETYTRLNQLHNEQHLYCNDDTTARYYKSVCEINRVHLNNCFEGLSDAFYTLCKDAKEKFCRPKYWKGKRGEYRCPDCGEEAPNNGYYPSNFCPRCGARFGDPEEKE